MRRGISKAAVLQATPTARENTSCDQPANQCGCSRNFLQDTCLPHGSSFLIFNNCTLSADTLVSSVNDNINTVIDQNILSELNPIKRFIASDTPHPQSVIPLIFRYPFHNTNIAPRNAAIAALVPLITPPASAEARASSSRINAPMNIRPGTSPTPSTRPSTAETDAKSCPFDNAATKKNKRKDIPRARIDHMPDDVCRR